jgi:hypothetical protein
MRMGFPDSVDRTTRCRKFEHPLKRSIVLAAPQRIALGAERGQAALPAPPGGACWGPLGRDRWLRNSFSSATQGLLG